MTEAGPLRILVLSDLHAYETTSQDAAPSAFSVSSDSSDTDRMCDGVAAALSEAGVDSVDLVVCPGDMADSAERAGLAGAWRRLNMIAEALSAPLVATVGNHDLVSRPGGATIDPREALIDLNPAFPSPQLDMQANYFTYHYAVASIPRARIVTLNSCSTHGLIEDKTPEYLHGRITTGTAKWIRANLSRTVSDEFSIALTHHHPLQLPGFEQRERSTMTDSTLLLEGLEETGEWLIIHGHKHRPWIQYANGGGGSAVVFSAASMSAHLNGDFAANVKNQIHLIELNSRSLSTNLGLGVSGLVRSWNRVPYGPRAWRPASADDTLMATAGFGWRASPREIATRFEAWLDSIHGSLDGLDVLGWDARMRYLLPQDMAVMAQEVNSRSRYQVELDKNSMPTSIRLVPEEVPV